MQTLEEKRNDQALEYALKDLETITKELDRIMGKGFAAKNPELIGQILMAAKIDYAGTLISDRINEGLDAISSSIDNIGTEELLED